jgi:Fatty acid hydroxylase superfamily
VLNFSSWEFWAYSAAYVTVATAIFMWLRRSSSTDEQAAALLDTQTGFGEPTSLGAAARQFFHHRCPQLLSVLCIGQWALRLYLGQWNWMDPLIVVGIVAFWPLQEWVIHVFILHFKPRKMLGRNWDPIISRNHRNHHRDPWHPELGITPPHMIWLYLAGLPGLWLLFLPIPQAATGLAIYFSLVLNYEWVHYLIHTAYAPKSWFYRRLWRNHRLHHFKNEHYWYGVTMLSGDLLLHTQPVASETTRSDTCTNLAGEPELAGLSETK